MRSARVIWYLVLAIFVAAGIMLLTRHSAPSTAAAADTATSTKKVNVIIIDICSLRSDHLSGNGYSRPTTPNLDALAKESADFANAWTASGWCLPNLTTMLTGTRPEVSQALYADSTSFPANLTTLAELLKQDGFVTAGFSGSRYMTSAYGLQRGFDTFSNTYSPDMELMGSMSFSSNFPAVKSWLSANKDKPFFLYVTIDDLHSPYEHAENPKLFDPSYKGILDTVPADLDFDREYNGDPSTSFPKLAPAVAAFKKDPRNLTDLIARYDAAVVTTDKLTGELIAELKKTGVWDNSIVVVTAHQGEQLGEHGLLGHINGIYEPILHVPLFIHYPDSPQNGQRLPELVERIDIPATILAAEGLQDPQFTGTNLLPLLVASSSPSTWKQYIFASSKPTWAGASRGTGTMVEERAVRDARYKLIWYAYKTPQYELYDLLQDPKETKNLVQQLPDVFDRLKSELDSYAEQYH